jgi:hypothetical protein
MSPDSGGSRFTSIPGPILGEAVTKTGAVVPLSVEVLEDGRIMAKAIDDAWDRYLRPWNYPDRPAWPDPDLFPSVRHALTAAQEARTRVRNAWQVLRGHETIYDHTGDDW